jgi:ubiquinol-cytochrome c reductase iron-sulfur subunit
MSKARNYFLSALVLLVGRRRSTQPRDTSRIVPPGTPNRRAESAALGLLFLGSLLALAFVVIYIVDAIPDDTQLLGVSLGLALICIAASLVIVARKVIVTEELMHPYPPEEHSYEQELVEEIVEESADPLTRRRLLKLGLISAGGALGLAAITPALSFGPLRTKSLYLTPWRKGRRLVDEQNRPLRAVDIEEKSFYTAFPEGASKEELGAPLVLVRLPVHSLRLPPDLAGYDANGIVAYSKICTHAGCAISMYRVPLFQPDEPRAALVCPCHYSTFDPADGGSVTFGPAGRALPMLPLTVDAKGYLRAQGTFNGAIGPSWSGVRSRRPST